MAKLEDVETHLFTTFDSHIEELVEEFLSEFIDVPVVKEQILKVLYKVVKQKLSAAGAKANPQAEDQMEAFERRELTMKQAVEAVSEIINSQHDGTWQEYEYLLVDVIHT